MDYISEFDIRLDKEMYYAGETLSGCVILSTKENFKLKGEYLGADFGRHAATTGLLGQDVSFTGLTSLSGCLPSLSSPLRGAYC